MSKTVPDDPTEEMVTAAWKVSKTPYIVGADIRCIYKAMLATAPSRQPANAELSDAVFCKLCSAVITDEDLRIRIKPTHEAADAFWKHWRENGETHKHGYYESTWGAINAALNAQPNALSLDKRGIRQQGGEPHDVAEFYKDDAAEQRTAAQQHPVTPHLSMPGLAERLDSTNGVSPTCGSHPCEQGSGDIAAASAAPNGLTEAEATTNPLRGKYGEFLTPFVNQMEFELHANSGKGDRAGWLSMSREVGLLEIYYHLAKLQKAVKKDNRAEIKEFSADVANMSMMLSDICGALIVAPGGE